MSQSRCTFCRCTGHQIRQCEDPRVQNIQNSIQTLIQDNEEFISFDAQQHQPQSRAILEAFFDDIHDLGTIKMFCILQNIPINQSILIMRRDLTDSVLFQRAILNNSSNQQYITFRQQEDLRTQKRATIMHLHDQIQQLQTDLTVHIYAHNTEEMEEINQIEREIIQITRTQMHDKIQEIRDNMVEYCDLFGRPAYQNLIRIMSMSGEIVQYNLGINSQTLRSQFRPPAYEIIQQNLKEGEEWSAIECPVCYEDIVPENVHMTPCQHKFCHDCITHALKTKLSCPLCRENISCITFRNIV
jgi:hypothetical protein